MSTTPSSSRSSSESSSRTTSPTAHATQPSPPTILSLSSNLPSSNQNEHIKFKRYDGPYPAYSPRPPPPTRTQTQTQTVDAVASHEKHVGFEDPAATYIPNTPDTEREMQWGVVLDWMGAGDVREGIA